LEGLLRESGQRHQYRCQKENGGHDGGGTSPAARATRALPGIDSSAPLFPRVQGYHFSFDSFFLAILLRPSAISSASSRVASGVNWITPSDMILEKTGAASQRDSLPFSPNWLKMA